MSAVLRKSSIADLESSPNIQEILDEYALESAIKGLPSPSAKVEIYKHLEKTGALYIVAAFIEDILIGFITVLSPVLPHYGRLVAVAESFFVAKDHRKSGAGLFLLRAAELHAREIGSPGLLVSAPVDGDLVKVLPYVGYKETNRVFFRGFASE